MSERKTVFITGASRGIGHATAAYFVRHGWRAITCSREEVPPQCLGALSGLSKRSIYDLINRGEIEAGGDRGSTVIGAAVAKRWLEARGVKGL